MQTQTSNKLHNAIMEASSKDRPPMLALGIDYDIYSTVDACSNACEMWKAIERFVTLVKQSQELKTISYHILYDILKQHQHEVNEIRAEKITRVANPLTLVAQQQPVYHPQNHPNRYTQNSSTRSQQAATWNRGKAIVNSPQPIYDQQPSMIAEDDETSKDKEIDKLMDLISLSNAGYENQRSGNVAGARETVGSSMVQKSGIQCYNCKEFGHVVRECQKPKKAKDAAYHREKMLLCKQKEAGIQLNAEQADWRDDIDDELEDQELEAHYMYMAQLQEVSLDVVDSGPIFDDEPLQKKLKCEIDESKNRNKFLETSNMVLIEKLKGAIEDFKNKDKSLESSNNFFKEANNRLTETNNLLYADYKKSKAELARRNSKEYASQMELECAKVRAPNSDEVIRLKKESRSKLSDLIRPFDYDKLNNLAKDAAYHREKMLLCKQEEAEIQLNVEQADWKDDTDDESDDQELEAHYMYMAKL
nr:hypothetical protein [Tanacetum cinerariifolium]